VVSIFVNPIQFNDANDLERYPRDLVRDTEMCEEVGVNIVFAPDVKEMYPRSLRAKVSVSGVSDHLEGPNRPGHFDGVATVVAKLFAGIRPDEAFFGRKDAQQLAVILAMAEDLSFPLRVVPCSTMREADGLALSSRNVFLSHAERMKALGISVGLFAAADAVEAGERDGKTLAEIAASWMGDLEVEYVSLASQSEAAPIQVLDQPSFLAVAARNGKTRLIDNVSFDLDAVGEVHIDRGVFLDKPSCLYRSL
jgi:pantoate--beta-alanine ligase